MENKKDNSSVLENIMNQQDLPEHFQNIWENTPITELLATDDKTLLPEIRDSIPVVIIDRLRSENQRLNEELSSYHDVPMVHKLSDELMLAKERIKELEFAARTLRNAQRSYMAHRGDQQLGKAVNVAGMALDKILGDSQP